MTKACHKILSLLSVAFLHMGVTHAQPKALGTDYSFSGISISYEHQRNEECFIHVALKTELSEVMMNRTDTPGISASFTCNFILDKWKSRNGNDIRLFFGPGIAVGSARDFKEEPGWFFGLKARGGVECEFSRNICISASLSPIIGVHMILLENSMKMQYYRYGLLNMIIPQIGIKYLF